jgi:heme exporter protein D
MSLWDKLDMGKYALYVWGSFGVTALCMIVEPLLLNARARRIRRQIARRIRLES